MVDHEGHAAKLGLSRDDLLSFKMGPLKYSYTRHQLATAYQGTIGDIQAVLLACQWGYGKCTRTLVAQKGLQPDNPYKDWFAFHTAEENLEGLELGLDLLDRQAAQSGEAQRKKMADAFMLSVQHETMLWDEYYNKGAWESYPVPEGLG